MSGRFDDADFDEIIDGIEAEDPEADSLFEQFTLEEREGLRQRVSAREALDRPGGAEKVARHRRLKRAESTGSFPTTQGLMAPVTSRSLPDRMASGLDEMMGRAALPSRALGEASQPPMEVAAEDPRTGTQILQKAQDPLGPYAGLRPFAGAMGRVAGMAEFPITGPTQAASALLKGKQGSGEMAELLQGAISPIQATTDIVMAPGRFGERMAEDPGGTIADVALTGLGVLGAARGIKGVENRAFTRTVEPIPLQETPPSNEPSHTILEGEVIPPQAASPPGTPPPGSAAPPPLEGVNAPPKVAPVTFNMEQPGAKGKIIEWWTLNEEIPGHKKGNVTRDVLEAEGWTLPPRDTAAPSPPLTPSTFASNLISQIDSPNPPPTSPRTVAKVGIDVAEPASRFATALMRLNEPAQALASDFARLSHSDPIKSANYIDNLFTGVATLIEKQAYSRPKTWREAMFTTPTMDSAVTRHIAANRSSFVMATQAWELGGPAEIFKRGSTLLNRPAIIKWRTGNALKLLWDDRAQAVLSRTAELVAERARLAQELDSLRGSLEPDMAARRTSLHAQLAELPDPADSAPSRYPLLDPAERAAIFHDPAMQDFATWFRDSWTPMVEGMSTDVGISARLRGPLGGYVSFVDAWVDAKGVPPSLKGQGSRSPYDVRPRRPKSARTATGAAPEELALSDDLFRYFYNTLSDRMVAATKRDLMAELRAASLSTASTLSPMGQVPLRSTTIQTSRGPRQVPVRAVTLEKLGGRTEDIYYVPEPYAQLFDYAVKAPTKSELEAMTKINSALTAQIVILPAEAVRHGWNVASAVTSTEWHRTYGHTGRALDALSGAHGKMTSAFYKAWNLEGPEFARHIQELADSNGLRLSNWERTPERGGLVQFASSGRFNPLHALKESVFGYPGLNKGVKGLETRLRVAVKIAMEEADPSMSDPRIGRRINASLGSYVKEIVPPLAEGLQKVYPFARARTALVRQGISTATGFDILGKFNPYIAVATASTIAQCLVLNKLLDDKKRWPWEVPGWNPGSLILFEWNGRKVSIGADLVMNSLYRAGKATGITRAIEMGLNGTSDTGAYVTEFGRSWLNFLSSWAGPLATTLTVAGTGSVPYITADGKLMSIEETSMAGSEAGKGHSRMKAIIKTAIPAMAKGKEWAEASGHAPRPTTEPWNSLFTTAELFGVAPTISGVAPEDAAQISTYYRSIEDARKIAFEALSKARNLSTDPGVQIAFIRDYVNRHTNPNMIVLDGDKPKPANIFSFEIALGAFKNQIPRRQKGKVMSRQPALQGR